MPRILLEIVAGLVLVVLVVGGQYVLARVIRGDAWQ